MSGECSFVWTYSRWSNNNCRWVSQPYPLIVSAPILKQEYTKYRLHTGLDTYSRVQCTTLCPISTLMSGNGSILEWDWDTGRYPQSQPTRSGNKAIGCEGCSWDMTLGSVPSPFTEPKPLSVSLGLSEDVGQPGDPTGWFGWSWLAAEQGGCEGRWRGHSTGIADLQWVWTPICPSVSLNELLLIVLTCNFKLESSMH